MQYLREEHGGKRVSVTEEQYNIDRLNKKTFWPIITTDTIRVYRMNVPDRRPLEKPLKFGGRFMKNGVARYGL
ncbi:hypothetical protein KDA08_03610 [Candidatus Saccharibacteria bacterium]|nr:hypothetical protein [Candidatus Saccharibacteria bacterium]